MSWTPKDPAASEFFDLDFSQLLADGDSVSSITSAAIVNDDATLTLTNSALNGNRVVFRLTGGVLDRTYEVRAVVVTAAGETLSLTGTLLMRIQR
jgi:hypothetical protein